jgi:hypothetical protein
MLSDFGCHFDAIPLLCDNESAIKLANDRYNTPEQSTYIFDINFYGIMRLREILLYDM